MNQLNLLVLGISFFRQDVRKSSITWVFYLWNRLCSEVLKSAYLKWLCWNTAFLSTSVFYFLMQNTLLFPWCFYTIILGISHSLRPNLTRAIISSSALHRLQNFTRISWWNWLVVDCVHGKEMIQSCCNDSGWQCMPQQRGRLTQEKTILSAANLQFITWILPASALCMCLSSSAMPTIRIRALFSTFKRICVLSSFFYHTVSRWVQDPRLCYDLHWCRPARRIVKGHCFYLVLCYEAVEQNSW